MILAGRPSASPTQEHIMKLLFAAATVAASFAAASASSAHPMPGSGHPQAHGSSNWQAGPYGQQRWGDRHMTGYAASHSVRYDRDRDRSFGRWNNQPSNYGYGVGYGVDRHSDEGRGARSAFPSQRPYRQHW